MGEGRGGGVVRADAGGGRVGEEGEGGGGGGVCACEGEVHEGLLEGHFAVGRGCGGAGEYERGEIRRGGWHGIRTVGVVELRGRAGDAVALL